MRPISSEQILKRIKTENPWWREPHEIPSDLSELRPRPYLDLFLPLAKNRSVRRAVVLMGPRRVGKTVMIHHAIAELINEGIAPERICYISVDHPIYNGLNLDDLLELYAEASGVNYSKEECFAFFDEVQYLKDWERYLKIIVDRLPKVKCVASGSAAAALRLKSSESESGAGRFTDFLIPPLTFYEYLFLTNKSNLVSVKLNEEREKAYFFNTQGLNDEFLNYINYGGYPEAIFSEDVRLDPGRFVKSDIIDKVLLRDLPGLYGIRDVQELYYLFVTLAYNTANEISLDQLSKNSGVAKNTIKKYIEYLEAAFLIRIVHRVDKNARRFKRAKLFKVYLTNPSIRSALFDPVDADDEATGDLVETAVFTQFFHSGDTLHYARWNGGEVDIVGMSAKEQKADGATEIKWSDRYFEKPRELKSLISFCHAQNLTEATATTINKKGEKTMDSVKITFAPAALYCYLIGKWIIEGKKETVNAFTA